MKRINGAHSYSRLTRSEMAFYTKIEISNKIGVTPRGIVLWY